MILYTALHLNRRYQSSAIRLRNRRMVSHTAAAQANNSEIGNASQIHVSAAGSLENRSARGNTTTTIRSMEIIRE